MRGAPFPRMRGTGNDRGRTEPKAPFFYRKQHNSYSRAVVAYICKGGLRMFKKWRNEILIEGQKEAREVARLEKLPDVDATFDDYPVDYKKPGLRSFKEALRIAMEYSERGIYNIFYKERRKPT